MTSSSPGQQDTGPVASRVVENSKSEFRRICEDKSKKLIVHFDGKLVGELDPKKVHKKKKDRVAMLVRSPDLEQREQLLGIPEMNSGSGIT